MLDTEQYLMDIYGLTKPWRMAVPERLAILAILERIRPKFAIEVGTAEGGCLEAIAKFSEVVWSIDVNPDVANSLRGEFPNVEFHTGYAQELLPMLIDRATADKHDVGFILIDGDHSRRGVQSDIRAVLRYVPVSTTIVVLHDSFNPECRLGIAGAPWSDSPHVHAVDIDFVPGCLWDSLVDGSRMWGGLAMAIVRHEVRMGELRTSASYGPIFRTCTEAIGTDACTAPDRSTEAYGC